MNGKKRVVIGLSGGVDSSVGAALLLEQGYEVSGVYLECYNEPGCRTDQDKADALKVALKLGIPFQVLDFRKEYKEKVVEYFYREYEAGRTPNPDVMCNREIKFGIFYDWAMSQGYDYVATGHYARIRAVTQQHGDTVTLFLQRARDESKDQSYFLWQIPQNHLGHILFPLGEMLKSEVRERAKKLGLLTANKPDSMGICFIGEVNVNNLLKERLGEKSGEVVIRQELGARNQELVVGKHRGLWFYTIGERGGWEMKINSQISNSQILKLGIQTNNLPPLYVIGKDKEKNQLVVGTREETMVYQFRIQELGIRKEELGEKLWVRIRNLGELYEVKSLKLVNSRLEIETAEAVFGVAEGQSAVFYDEQGVLVGGGIIV